MDGAATVPANFSSEALHRAILTFSTLFLASASELGYFSRTEPRRPLCHNPTFARSGESTRCEKMDESSEQSLETQDPRSLLRREERCVHDLIHVVIPNGVALAYETDFNRLLEKMLLDAMGLCNADGGTLYLRTEDDLLQFKIMRTQSLGIALGGTTGLEIPYAPIPLFDPITRQPNLGGVSAHAALTGKSVNVADVYEPGKFGH